MQRMRWRSLVLVALMGVQALRAQLSDKPGTWLRLEGQYVADADPGDVFFMMMLTRSLTNEAGPRKLKPEAVDLAAMTWQAAAAGNVNAGSRLFGRLVAVQRGLVPGEWLEAAASLQFQLDRRIAAPGVILHARLDPVFRLDQQLQAAFTARFTLLDPAGKAVKQASPLRLESIQGHEVTLLTNGLAPGAYTVRYELQDAAGKALISAARPILISDTLGRRIEALERQRESIAAAGIARKSLRHAAAVESVEFIARLYMRALREPVNGFHQRLSPLSLTLARTEPPYYSTDPIDVERDLPLAESLAEALLAGGDALAARTGDLRLGYRSARDQAFHAYRVYVPPAYDGSKKWPLLVLLHAETGDEGSLFERSPAGGESVFVKLARDRGYVVVAPEVNAPFGDYSNAAAQVLDVIGRVKGIYSVDEAQVFLAGHAAGSLGVLTVSMGPEAHFAALAGVAVTPLRPIDFSRAPDVPLLLLQPSGDALAPLDEARRFGYVLQKRFKRFDYDELQVTDHFASAAAAAPRFFDFFDAVRAGSWKPSGKPVPLPQTAR